jgi:replicative DNA helicase
MRGSLRAVPNSVGRVPPHDLDAEAAVLSACLLCATAVARAAELLAPDHFYSEAHRRVFEAAVALGEASTPVDVVTVAGWLKDRDRLAQIGGMPYLHEILGAAPALAPAQVDAYARIVFDKWRLRTLIETCQRVAAEGYTDVGDLDAFLDDAESRVHQATSSRGKANTVQTMRTAARSAFATIQAHAENHVSARVARVHRVCARARGVPPDVRARAVHRPSARGAAGSHVGRRRPGGTDHLGLQGVGPADEVGEGAEDVSRPAGDPDPRPAPAAAERARVRASGSRPGC